MARKLDPGEWELLRDLRLRALRDSPEAFAQSLEHARGLAPADWQERASASDTRAWFIEQAADKRLSDWPQVSSIQTIARSPSSARCSWSQRTEGAASRDILWKQSSYGPSRLAH